MCEPNESRSESRDQGGAFQLWTVTPTIAVATTSEDPTLANVISAPAALFSHEAAVRGR